MCAATLTKAPTTRPVAPSRPLWTAGSGYPSLYQVNTRVWLCEYSRKLGRQATLDDIPDADLDQLAAKGFDWIWLLSVWQTGEIGRTASRTRPEWRQEFQHTLPDLCDEDIGGSGFAITGYVVSEALGGNAALARMRQRLKDRGLRLMLDFVPNHMAIDHPWAEEHPEYFVAGTDLDLATAPHNYIWAGAGNNRRLLAHGRDPYFPGWPDTLQLNYANPALQEAMTAELLQIASQCDGVRCDMAMLVLPDIFEWTWGRRPEPFWQKATATVRDANPGFLFMAEVYWDLEWTLQQAGFDYTYDKRLYDRLRDGHTELVRGHLRAGLDFQNKLARFLENHDEPRAAATFRRGQHEAAAVATYFAPGLRFFHQGQFEGCVKRISPHLCRGPSEPVNGNTEEFYGRLLEALKSPSVRSGRWQLIDCQPAWDGNRSHDAILAYAWEGPGDERMLVAVNNADHASQAYVTIPFSNVASSTWRLRDLLSSATYDRFGHELATRGLYLDVPPWQVHVFRMDPLPS